MSRRGEGGAAGGEGATVATGRADSDVEGNLSNR